MVECKLDDRANAIKSRLWFIGMIAETIRYVGRIPDPSNRDFTRNSCKILVNLAVFDEKSVDAAP